MISLCRIHHFIPDAFETQNDARNKARFTSSLSFEELLEGVSKIIAEDGIFTTIIPYKEETEFINLAVQNKLFLNRVCRVRGNATTEIKRSLLEFSKHPKQLLETTLTIETGSPSIH